MDVVAPLVDPVRRLAAALADEAVEVLDARRAWTRRERRLGLRDRLGRRGRLLALLQGGFALRELPLAGRDQRRLPRRRLLASRDGGDAPLEPLPLAREVRFALPVV